LQRFWLPSLHSFPLHHRPPIHSQTLSRSSSRPHAPGTSTSSPGSSPPSSVSPVDTETWLERKRPRPFPRPRQKTPLVPWNPTDTQPMPKA
jgi:hypothetical protein